MDQADTIKAKLDQIPDRLLAIQTDAENANVGPLIVKGFSLRARAIGLEAKAGVWSLHSDMTEAAKARGEGATVYKGRLVDIASIRQAEVIVRQAELIGA